MVIDWFTVVAQFLNFLVLVWLLKRFLYRPILGAIATREQRIVAELADAAATKAQAQAERDEFVRRNQAMDELRADAIAKIQSEARAERERLLGEARAAARGLRDKQANALQTELAAFAAQMATLASDEVVAAARRLLADLADTDLEVRIGAVFVRRLRELDEQDKAVMRAAIESADEPVTVRSGFALPAESCDAIARAVEETFHAGVRLEFVTAPEAICGVELVVNGRKLAWSAGDYLGSFQRQVETLLDASAMPGSGPDAGTPA